MERKGFDMGALREALLSVVADRRAEDEVYTEIALSLSGFSEKDLFSVAKVARAIKYWLEIRVEQGITHRAEENAWRPFKRGALRPDRQPSREDFALALMGGFQAGRLRKEVQEALGLDARAEVLLKKSLRALDDYDSPSREEIVKTLSNPELATMKGLGSDAATLLDVRQESEEGGEPGQG